MQKKLLFIGILTIFIVGCNIFSWTDTTDEDLYYDGLELFNQKKFSEAKEKFAAAMEQDPLRSDYRYYHAKAAIFETEINFLSVGRSVIKPTKSNLSGANYFYLPLYSREEDLKQMSVAQEYAYKTSIYHIVSVCHRDIDLIYKRETHGGIQREDILFEYSLFSLARCILQMRDTNNDGVINEKDLYFQIFTTSDKKIEYKIDIPPNLDRNQIIDAVKNSVTFLGEGVVALYDTFADTAFKDLVDTEKLRSTMEQLEIELKRLLP